MRKKCYNKLSILIFINQRIVQAIGVTVKILAEIRHLHIGIGAEKASYYRIIQPGIHVYQSVILNIFMSAIPPQQKQFGRLSRSVHLLRIGIAKTSPRIVTQFLQYIPGFVYNMGNATHIITTYIEVFPLIFSPYR